MKQLLPFQISSEISFVNHLDHFLARCGIKRMQHTVKPGLYALGKPDKDSSVFVTANYTLSFDALRSSLIGRDAYVLVLDTRGINVWCAAGKGNFGTKELISKIESTGLKKMVEHQILILPQLGATGVSAHQVNQASGFKVEYGPVRAEDLPEYLKTHHSTLEMRKVRFDLKDRLTLAPVEMVNSFIPMLIIAGIMYLLGGWINLFWVLAAWFSATVLFLAVLPLIPTREFSTKGFLLGLLITIPFAAFQFLQNGNPIWQNLMRVVPMGLTMTAILSYFTLNLTGSTLITCWTGVRHEIFKYTPIIAWMAGSGIILSIVKLLVIGR